MKLSNDLKREKIQRPTSNIERPMWKTLRFFDFILWTNHSLWHTRFNMLRPAIVEMQFVKILKVYVYSPEQHIRCKVFILKLIRYIIRRWTLDVRCWTFLSLFFDQTGRSINPILHHSDFYFTIYHSRKLILQYSGTPSLQMWYAPIKKGARELPFFNFYFLLRMD